MSRSRLSIAAFSRTFAGTAEWAAHAFVRPVARQAITSVRTFGRGRGRGRAGAGAIAPSSG
jgi:hypothetical protein